MALIYRSIFDVDDPAGSFASRAATYFQDWARRKVGDIDLELAKNGIYRATAGPGQAQSIEVSTAEVQDSGLHVFRGTLFERDRDDGAEVRTTAIAIVGDGRSVAWIDLDRWVLDATADLWLTTAPNLVTAILSSELASRGPSLLLRGASIVEVDGANVARIVGDPQREIPVIVVLANEGDIKGPDAAAGRGKDLARRLAGISPVFVLSGDGIASFSEAIGELLGAVMDIPPGGIRTYLPGASRPTDNPGRHVVIPFHAVQDCDSEALAHMVAPGLLQRAAETPTPRIWDDRARTLIESGATDDAALTVRRLLAQGETGGVEYKSSLRYDLATGGASTAVTRAITKTAAAFMNGQGGTLLIGVADDGSVVGIEHDFQTLRKQDVDGFELALRETIGTCLGEDINPTVDVTFGTEAGQTVAIVTCKAHHRPVFHEESNKVEFYVRSGNSSRPLDVRETVEYVAHRFPAGSTSPE